MKTVYEMFFVLKNVHSWSFLELYNLPVALRGWFVEKYLEQASKANAK